LQGAIYLKLSFLQVKIKEHKRATNAGEKTAQIPNVLPAEKFFVQGVSSGERAKRWLALCCGS
jgi:hypothetical protein